MGIVREVLQEDAQEVCDVFYKGKASPAKAGLKPGLLTSEALREDRFRFFAPMTEEELKEWGL